MSIDIGGDRTAHVEIFREIMFRTDSIDDCRNLDVCRNKGL